MLFLQKQTENELLGIWKIEESATQLLSFLNRQYLLEEDILNVRSESKVLERLAVRVLLKELLQEEVEIFHHESGRPYLADKTTNISISHTKSYVTIVLSKEKYVGIDIQYITEKIKKIRPRFVSDQEYINANDELIHLLLHWSAKESLYKAIGGGVDLKESFLVSHFVPEENGVFQVLEKVTGNNRKFDVCYMVTSDFVLTYTL